MSKILRDYQQRFIDCIRSAFVSGERGICGELFTGAGKAFVLAVIAKMVRDRGGRCLCLVNRDNLVEQLFKSLCEQGLHPVMERGQDKASPMSDLVVGSIQTLQNDRLKKWSPEHFKMVICDEVHFAAADTFKATLNHFKSAFHLGLTATLLRHDKKGLWEGYKKDVFHMSLTEGIEQGWLVPLIFQELPVPIIVDKKAATKKMFTESDEVELFDQNDYLPRLFAAAATECVGKKALMFWPGCKASEKAAEHFNGQGIESQHVDGYMSKTSSAQKLEWFATCETGVLHNADLLCLDDKTEILTHRGFIARSNYNAESDLVANWLTDGTVFFRIAREYCSRPVDVNEVMVSIESKRINFRVTGHHDMVVACGDRSKSPKWKKRKALDIAVERFPGCGVAQAPRFDFTRIQPVVISAKKRRRLICAQAFNLRTKNGYESKESQREAIRRVDRKLSMRYKEPHELTSSECRFIGFWIADGSLTLHKDGTQVMSCVQSTVYPRIVKWVDNVVSATGIDYTRRVSLPTGLDNSIVTWRFCKGTGGAISDKSGWFPLTPYLQKNGCDFLWGLNESQFDALVEGYWYGDGLHGQADNGVPRSLRFNDTRLAWLELLQAIGSVRGWLCDVFPATAPVKSNHTQQHYLRMIKGGVRNMSSSTIITYEYPKGETVWCVSVDSGMIITRRKGKVQVLGNSYGYDNPSINLVGIMRLQKSIPMLLQRIGRGTRAVRDAEIGVDSFDNAEARKAWIAQSPKPSCTILDLMLQIEGAKHNFATPGCLITADPEEQEYIRKQRASGKSIDLKELDGMLKTKRRIDSEKSLTRLAEDAANAARKASQQRRGPFIGHILNKPAKPGWKPASPAQLSYLAKLGYRGDCPSGYHASRIIDAYKEHKLTHA
jgi:superfamily II DNA or RNA helicase